MFAVAGFKNRVVNPSLDHHVRDQDCDQKVRDQNLETYYMFCILFNLFY